MANSEEVSLPADQLDLAWGAAAIAAYIGKSTRATFHLLEQGKLPARKVGNQWVASKERLRHALMGAPND